MKRITQDEKGRWWYHKSEHQAFSVANGSLLGLLWDVYSSRIIAYSWIVMMIFAYIVLIIALLRI